MLGEYTTASKSTIHITAVCKLGCTMSYASHLICPLAYLSGMVTRFQLGAKGVFFISLQISLHDVEVRTPPPPLFRGWGTPKTCFGRYLDG